LSKKEDDKYYAEFELAGVKREDINVTFTDKTLTFKSPKRSTTSQFPEDVDSVDATYVDGLLKLVVTLKVPPLTNVEIK
jgi:HSP20 family molecular chaperone IbpA